MIAQITVLIHRVTNGHSHKEVDLVVIWKGGKSRNSRFWTRANISYDRWSSKLVWTKLHSSHHRQASLMAMNNTRSRRSGLAMSHANSNRSRYPRVICGPTSPSEIWITRCSAWWGIWTRVPRSLKVQLVQRSALRIKKEKKNPGIHETTSFWEGNGAISKAGARAWMYAVLNTQNTNHHQISTCILLPITACVSLQVPSHIK